ncbi:MAG TPA: AraC family transcriptional regulator, partial [Bacilli bacterium]
MRMIRMIANKGVLQIFFAMLLVVIVMFVSNYIVFKNSISEIYGQVSENNRLVTTNIIQSFDNFFRDINNVIHSINMLPYDDQFDTFNTYLMQKNIATFISPTTMEYIEEAVIFFNGSDLAITTTGTIDLDVLFKQKYRHGIYNSGYWKSYAASKHSLKVFPEAYYSEFTSPYAEIRKRLLIVAGSNQLSPKNVMILIDAEKLLKHVSQKTMMEGSSLIILDQDRNVIFNTEKDWDLANVLDDLYFDAGRETTLKRKGYEYNFFKSDYNGFI